MSQQCDESCHEANRNSCSLCDTLEWDKMCDSCRYYASQDGFA